MLSSILQTKQSAMLEQALKASSLRQKVINNNIANVNTPGFKKSEVVFENLLQAEVNSAPPLPLTVTNGRHIQTAANEPFAPVVNMVADTSARTDGNNVDIDAEMAEMAKNNIYYSAVAQQMGSFFSSLMSAIKEGKG